MRLIKSLIALCFVVLGVIFGALNKQRVHVDLWFDSMDGRLGLILLSVLLLGALIGGLAVMAGVVWPMRRRLQAGQDSVARPGSGPVDAEPFASRDTAP